MEIVSSKIEGQSVTVVLQQTDGDTEEHISVRIGSEHVHADYPLAWIQLEALKSARRKLDVIINKLVKDLNTI